MIEVRYEFLPEAYLVPCARPTWAGGNWLDVATLSRKRDAAIADCNDRLREAREFQIRERDRLAPPKK